MRRFKSTVLRCIPALILAGWFLSNALLVRTPIHDASSTSDFYRNIPPSQQDDFAQHVASTSYYEPLRAYLEQLKPRSK